MKIDMLRYLRTKNANSVEDTAERRAGGTCDAPPAKAISNSFLVDFRTACRKQQVRFRRHLGKDIGLMLYKRRFR